MTDEELGSALRTALGRQDGWAHLADLGLPVRGSKLGHVALRLLRLGQVKRRPKANASHEWLLVPDVSDEPLLDRVLRCATALFPDVSKRWLLGRRRFEFVVEARHAVWLALRRGGVSYNQIGHWFERDHSTVISGCRRAEERCTRDPDYAARVHTLAGLHPTVQRRRSLQVGVASARGESSATTEMST